MIKKKIGVGSSSIILMLFGVLWCFSFKNVCLGDIILNSFNLMAWTEETTGFHIGILYSLIFFIPAWIIASKYIDDWGAKAVRIISFFLSLFILVIGIDYFLSLWH